ncbi:unnamed protein product [Kluyveromyces dobzhanskii CBS 2104]|uniref:WGS project CCBQ000000000 data, contig 00016 n=1 Tax=Kluyveromyces dobzhanskii CBS 2104 TaxID=1427455 RepID=A0A0A8KZF3_9SACH|nr:unnamed protein product [Kluyveromyces dobzhanskii CBS 2104]
MKKRLQELLETNTVDENDPLMKITRNSSAENAEVDELYKNLEEKSFKSAYKAQLSVAVRNNILNKHSRDIATAKPWAGSEDPMDTSLRMILDHVPKSQGGQNPGSNIGFTGRSQTLRELQTPISARRSERVQNRLEQVQDKIVRYQQDKKTDDDVEKKEASEFRALYAEKFTPIGSFEKLRSVADARIEESMRKGDFQSVKALHGKDTDVRNDNAHIDRTAYHLNKILVRQKIVPPWIEKQGSVLKDIESFRDELKRKLTTEILNQMHRRKIFATGSTSSLGAFKATSLNPDHFLQSCFDSWAPSVKVFLESNIPRLNNNLRSYNLQAPLHTQKLYLLSERELERARSNVDLEDLFRQELGRQSVSKKISPESRNEPKPFSIFKLFGLD